MKFHRIIIILLCFVFCGSAFAQDMDTELANLTEKLATQIQAKEKKKIAVLDFTDLEGGSSELGKYIAEQLNVNFVMTNRNFSVLDRANLKSILDEHKLTSKGLIDPDNAKKLGLFAGVDALILGTIIPKGDSINLTAKIITTDTAEIVGAGRAQFKSDENVQHLLSSATVASNVGDSVAESDNDTAKVTKKLANLSVGLQSLQVVNGNQYLLTMKLANLSTNKSIWVALSVEQYGSLKGIIRDPNGFDFNSDGKGVSGVDLAFLQFPDFIYQATEIKPGDSTSVTVKFNSHENRAASAGLCTAQLEFLVGDSFANGQGHCNVEGFTAKIQTD
jgi:TolB-like protein